MNSQLVAFHKLGGKHSGVHIAKTVAHLLQRVGISLDNVRDSFNHWLLLTLNHRMAIGR